jgi:hypothetical protein
VALRCPEGLPEWPRFVAGEVDGVLQLGGLGAETAAQYLPLAPRTRALYSFVDDKYFSASGRMGAVLGPLPKPSDKQLQSAM